MRVMCPVCGLLLYSSRANKLTAPLAKVSSGRQNKWYSIYRQKQPMYRPLALRILGG